MGIFGGKFKSKAFQPYARKNIGVVGLGVIGGSIAKAIVENLKGANIVGVDPDKAVLDLCMKEHIINFGHTDPAILRGCEVIFVCTPIETVPDMINKVFAAVGDSAVITDVAGVKRQVFASLPKGIRFVSGHPMSGSEKSGFENSDSAFMENCTYILIKEINTIKADFDAVKSVINIFTGNIVEMDIETHDRAVAASSHLPHLIAYTLSDQVLGDSAAAQVIAGGFKDLTRVAQTETALWVNTCRLNDKAVIERTAEYIDALSGVKDMIEKKEWDKLEEYFERARALRLSVNGSGAGEESEK